MRIDRALIPVYLKVLEAEIKLAEKGKGGFGDHNGIAYLSEAIEALEKGRSKGLGHSDMCWQAWGAVSTLTPQILKAKPPLSDELYGKLVKAYVITNLQAAIAELEELDDDNVRPNIRTIADRTKRALDL